MCRATRRCPRSGANTFHLGGKNIAGKKFILGVEPKIGWFFTPQNGWFISWKILLKWMIWGVPLFLETPILYKLSIAVPLIDIYTSRRRVSLFCVLPLAVGKSGWNSPPKLFCVFLALGAVRTFLYAGRQVDEAGWRGLIGTWHVQVLSSMYSRASEQVLQNALRISK